MTMIVVHCGIPAGARKSASRDIRTGMGNTSPAMCLNTSSTITTVVRWRLREPVVATRTFAQHGAVVQRVQPFRVEHELPSTPLSR